MKNWIIPILFFVVSIASLGKLTFAQTLNITSGGQPTITGALNGSVTGTADVTQNLTVTINFGEVSAANTNNIVKVVVPLAIRSREPYMVTVAYTGSTNLNAQALQKTDIGFGVNNLRAMGTQSQVCTNSNHIFYSPFNNDPSTNVTINSAGRAAYPSTLNNIGSSTVILSGPRLTHNSNNIPQTNDAYIFDAIFAITPQYYAAGLSTASLTFTISSGPNVPC